MNQKEIKNGLYIICIILVVIGLGLFAFNQAMTWFYKSEFLQSPCGLCEKLNQNITCQPKLIVTNNNSPWVSEWNISSP